VLIGHDGSVYVSNFGVVAGGGTVVRLRGVVPGGDDEGDDEGHGDH
jgi:hypothetical protein